MSIKTNKVETPMCDRCGKTFKSKQYLRNHKNRTTSCDKKYPCKKCGRIFPTPSKLRAHERRKTPCVPEEVPIVTNNNEENMCHICGKTYSSNSNLRRHQRVCDRQTNLSHMVKLLVEQNKQQQETIQALMLEKQIAPVNNSTNITVNNIQQNMYVNVTICSFGKEDLSRLDSTKVMNLLKGQVKDFMPKMIEHVHANPDHPEYHNVFYDPERQQAIVYAPISDTEFSWQSRDFSEVSANLTEKIKQHINPSTGPYFNLAMKEKDTDTANKIIRIAQEEQYNDPASLEQTQGVLAQVSKNKEFMELVAGK
jgi:hypothetical protein